MSVDYSVSCGLQEDVDCLLSLYKMGSLTLVMSAFAILVVIGYTDALRQCPQPSKVYTRTPKCKCNADCKQGKLCCKNQSNEMSCAEPVNHGGTGSDKYTPDGGVDCDGVKCTKYEKCEFDKITKRRKCVRT